MVLGGDIESVVVVNGVLLEEGGLPDEEVVEVVEWFLRVLV